MDDQEVAGEVELLDQCEFVFELRPGPRRQRVSIARAGSFPGELAQPRGLGFATGDGEDREAVAEIFECEGAAFGDFACLADPFRAVGEAASDLAAFLEVALAVGENTAPGHFERGLVSQAGEGVEQGAVGGTRTAHVARRHDLDSERFCEGGRAASRARRRSLERAGDGDAQVIASEDAQATVEEGPVERGFVRRECEQAVCVFFDLLPGREGVLLGTSRVCEGDQTSEVPPAPGRLDQQANSTLEVAFERKLGSCDPAHADGARCGVEARATRIRRRDRPARWRDIRALPRAGRDPRGSRRLRGTKRRCAHRVRHSRARGLRWSGVGPWRGARAPGWAWGWGRERGVAWNPLSLSRYGPITFVLSSPPVKRFGAGASCAGRRGLGAPGVCFAA